SVGYLFNLEVQTAAPDEPATVEGSAVAAGAAPNGAAPNGAAPNGTVGNGAAGNGARTAAATAGGNRSASGGTVGAPVNGETAGGTVPAGAGTDGGGPDEPRQVLAKGLDAPQRPARLSYSAPSVDGAGGVATSGTAGDGTGTADVAADPYAGTPRNAPCPCG